MRVSVIGSGLAGLTTAAYLAKRGHEVKVFEQYHQVGGVTQTLEKDGYQWDLGQLMIEGLGPDEPVGEILASLGVLEQIRFRKEDRGYVFPDFELRKPAEYTNPLWRIDLLKQLFPDEKEGLDRYWKDYLRFTHLMTVARRLDKTGGISSLFWKARLYTSLLPFLSRKDWSAQKLMDHYFHSEKLKCVFISILADFFTSPSQFMGLGVFALNSETAFESRMPRDLGKDTRQINQYSMLGGISTLVKALVGKIEENGGKIYPSRAVMKIMVDRSQVTGVMDLDGTLVPADCVVASGGVRETFLNLVGAEHLDEDFIKKVKELPLMDSIFMVHLGVNYDPSPFVHGPVTYFYGTYDIEGGLAEARQGIYHEGKSGFVVHVPSLHSPEMAPVGCHAVTIYTICPNRLVESTWSDRKLYYADQLVGYAEEHIPGLREHIQAQMILTPEDFRSRTCTDPHAFGGLAPVLGSQRIPYETPIKGLWFVGAQSESGGGVNAVIPGAWKAAQKIDRIEIKA